jgi:hypothetical protein
MVTFGLAADRVYNEVADCKQNNSVSPNEISTVS